MKRILGTSILMLVAVNIHAAVEVHSTPDFPNEIKKIAVAPLPCHEEVNCQKIEKALNKSVKKSLKGVVEVPGTGVVTLLASELRKAGLPGRSYRLRLQAPSFGLRPDKSACGFVLRTTPAAATRG